MSYSALFKNRNFVLLWASQFLFQIAYNLISFALIVSVFELTRSNFLVGVLMFSFFLPSFLVSLPAGVYTDIFSRKRILLLTKLLWALFVLSFLYAKSNFLLIIAISLVVQAVDEFSIPAERALLPRLVRKENLLFANSLFSFSLHGSLLLGFGLAGPLMRFVGRNVPFFLASALSGLAALSVALITTREESFFHAERGLLQTLREELLRGGRKILAAKNVLRIILMIASFRGAVSILATLSPGYMEQGLGIYSWDASFVLALPLGVGIVLGTLAAGFLGKVKGKSFLILLGIFLSGASFLGMAGGPTIRSFFYNQVFASHTVRYFEYLPTLSSVVMLLACVCGLGGGLIYVSLQTAFQEETPNRLLGRAQAFLNIASYTINIIPTLFFAALADFLGVTSVLFFLALVILGVGIYFSKSGKLRKMGI